MHINFSFMPTSIGCQWSFRYICFMSTSIAVFGCVDKILISFMIICFMSTSIAINGWVDQPHINFVSCQLPLHSLPMLLKFISMLFYVNFHCSFLMHWWHFYWFSFMSASIAIIRCLNEIHINDCFMSTDIAVIGVNEVFDTLVLCQPSLPLSNVLLNFISTLFYVNFHCRFWLCWGNLKSFLIILVYVNFIAIKG